MIYFDNAATTKIYDDALTSYVQVSQKFFGNPSSLHQLGVDAHQVLTKARSQVASLLSVQPEEIFFTSGGTESNNWAIKGTALEKSVFGKHIITTKIEHPSVLQTCKQLERFGFEVTYLDVDSKGIVNVEQLKESLRKDTILVSVMAVNNEVGSVQPIAEIAKVLEEYPSIHFHVDAVQAVERASQLLAIGRIDLLSLSAHKFHGTRGVGIMYKKFGRKIKALLTGVHFVLSQHKELKTVATDSHRLSQKKLTLEKNGDDFDVVIPSRSLREFSAVFTDDIETVEIFFANNQILFRSENISFYTRLLEGNYPDTDRLIPTDFNTTITFDVVNLRQSMERARLLSSATQNGTVKLEIKGGVVSAHVHSPEVGKVNEEIDTEQVTGNDLTISFNPTYLIDSLKALNSEKVTISFISAVRPFTLVPADTDEDFMQLITPVRTN